MNNHIGNSEHLKISLATLIFFCLCFAIECRGAPVTAEIGVNSSERRTGTVFSSEARLSYFVEGQGIPCLVVADAELISKTLSSELKNYFTFIFLNARVNMIEVGDINTISFDVLAEDVEQLRKSLNIQRVAVFGHSISGIIALQYARKYPEHTSFVIMNGTPPFVNQKSRDIEKAFWEENASKDRKLALTNKWKGVSRETLNKQMGTDSGTRLYVLDGPKLWYDFNFDATKLLKGTYWNMRLWSHIFTDLMPDFDLSKGKTIKVPVFLSLGKEDYYVPFTLWNDEKGKIPNLSFNLFEKSGHYPFFEEEELFRTKLIAWIESLKVRK